MSYSLPMSSKEPAVLTLIDKSSALIDGAAFLNFARLKSFFVTQKDGAKRSTTSPAVGGEPLNVFSIEQNKSIAPPTTNSAIEAEIEPEDWDSLFGAVEERLRDTVDSLDSATTELAPQDRLSRIKAVVLDCVSSLDGLHKALRRDRGLQAPLKPPSFKKDSADI